MAHPRPWFAFYPRDWRGDLDLQLCSIEARGLLIELMAIAHEGEPYGHLASDSIPFSDEKLRKLTSVSIQKFYKTLSELIQNKRILKAKGGALFIPRMVADEAKRVAAQEDGKKGGNPKLTQMVKGKDKGKDKGKVKGKDNPSRARPSQSESESESEEERKDNTVCPELPEDQHSGPADNDPIIAEYPCTGEVKVWSLHRSKLLEWKKCYDTIDVRVELKGAKQWVLDNPGRRKTARGMTRFLGSWLSRAANSPRKGVATSVDASDTTAAVARALEQHQQKAAQGVKDGPGATNGPEKVL